MIRSNFSFSVIFCAFLFSLNLINRLSGHLIVWAVLAFSGASTHTFRPILPHKQRRRWKEEITSFWALHLDTLLICLRSKWKPPHHRAPFSSSSNVQTKEMMEDRLAGWTSLKLVLTYEVWYSTCLLTDGVRLRSFVVEWSEGGLPDQRTASQ